jgi:hydroxyacylglutathione hydrolase
MTTANATRTIAIIGGGVSGSLTAFHLIRQQTPAQVILIDQRPDFGLGLAYSTPSLRHLLNVPAGKISALPDQPDHFLNWLRRNYDPSATGKTFAPRAVFGRYIQSLLATATGIKKKIATVTNVRVEKTQAVVTLESGNEIRADLVVLATGNFAPAPLPGIAPAAITNRVYHHNAWSKETYDDLPSDATVAIVGTGLTGVDVVLRLRELGHQGKIIAVSRHGIFPNRHEDYTSLKISAIPPETPATAIAYLRALRASIRAGAEWRAAVDSIRGTTNELWLRLPLVEKKRFHRHLQRRWDVVRHRMAPPIADMIDAEIASGSLEIREGYLASVDATSNGAHIIMRTNNGNESFHANRVINCTGPSMNYRRIPSQLLQNLFADGLVTLGPLGTGFHCASNGAVIDATGSVSEIMFNLGPGRLGDLFESIAVPELRQQAVDLAETLHARLRLRAVVTVKPEKTISEIEAMEERIAV